MTVLTPIVVGFAIVAGLVVVAIVAVGVQRAVTLRRESSRSERLREGGVSSLEWAWDTPSRPSEVPQETAPVTTDPPAAFDTRNGVVRDEQVPSELRDAEEPGGDEELVDDDAALRHAGPVDNSAALRHAGQSASEIVAAAERTAARYEDAARRTAVAAIEEAERKAAEIVAAAKRVAAESEDAANGTVTAKIEEAERRAAEVVAAAERRTAELEETARTLEVEIGQAPDTAGEIVAAARREAVELEQEAHQRRQAANAEAQRKASELVETARTESLAREETARRAVESMLEDAQRKAAEIVAQAEDEKSRVLSGIAQERALAEDMRRKLTALLDDVSRRDVDDSAETVAKASDPHDTVGARG